MASYENSTTSSSRKCNRSSSHVNVENALLDWFKEKRNQNIPLSGPILLSKAEDLAQKLSDNSFKGNTGWLDRFKARHGIVCRAISGESAVVDTDTANEWISTKLPALTKSYKPCDIFNADETGLFYKLLPAKTLQFKGESCHGGKRSKERITLLVAANMDGSEKLELLTIGKFENPRCFKGIKSLPVTYKANKRAWMTSQIFIEWIRTLDRKLTRQNRQILLLVDNCSAHPEIDNLKSTNL